MNIALLCHLQNPVTAVKVSSIDCPSVLNFSTKTEILNCLALIFDQRSYPHILYICCTCMMSIEHETIKFIKSIWKCKNKTKSILLSKICLIRINFLKWKGSLKLFSSANHKMMCNCFCANKIVSYYFEFIFLKCLAIHLACWWK